jgi:hypothetical protein
MPTVHSASRCPADGPADAGWCDVLASHGCCYAQQLCARCQINFSYATGYSRCNFASVIEQRYFTIMIYGTTDVQRGGRAPYSYTIGLDEQYKGRSCGYNN